ncbi:MAG: PQQ-binding-like beta-propeller repeat protein [Planctomycetales bacterium]|nr:PQQ-binding-like beta-propeller repeat protein [Planctomycetales bacterium]
MQMDPVLAALDANSDKEIASDEIAAAPTVLAKLDKNDDGKLTDDEVTADFGNRGEGGRRSSQGERGPGRGQGEGGRGRRGMSAMRIMPADRALDADENREIDAEELKASATALLTLDKNNDGKLTEDEVAPQFGRRGPSSSAAYASAIAIEVDGQRQYVQLLATTLVGINAADGQLLWRYDRAANRNRINCTTPVYHDGLVFAASAYGNGGGAVKLTKQPDGTFQAEEVYFTTKMQNHHGGVIVYDGCLYGANGGNEGGMLACLDFATGEDLWRDRKAEKGSLAFADGRLYLRTEEGEVVLIEPSRDRFIERGRFAQPDRTESPAWTHPVIANGKLYIRDQDTLFCYDVSK